VVGSPVAAIVGWENDHPSTQYRIGLADVNSAGRPGREWSRFSVSPVCYLKGQIPDVTGVALVSLFD